MDRDLNSKLTMSLEDVIKTDPVGSSRAFRGSRGGRRDFRPREDRRSFRPRRDEGVRMRVDRSRSRSRSRDVRMRDGVASSSRPAASHRVELRGAAARRSPSPGGRKMIKIGNLPPGISWKDLKDAFGGNLVDHADVDGPVGFLKFFEAQDALKAIREYDGGNLNGNKIYVRYA